MPSALLSEMVETSDLSNTTMTNLVLHKMFEAQTKRTPDNVALQFGSDISMTYHELNEASNRLANYLIETRPPAAGLVVLCLEKTPLLVVALLGVLKANLAWVPLPLDAPQKRIESILQSTQPIKVFTSRSSAPLVAGSLHVELLDELVDAAELRNLSGANLENDGYPEDLCHVLFTSGSTGAPKGVMLQHRAVAHNSLVLAKRWGLNSSTRTLQFAAPTFDVFGLDLFMTFSVGGCVVMASRADMLGDLTGFIRHARVTYAQLTPTVIRFIDPTGDLPSLKTLASSGEAMGRDVIRHWNHRVRLINAYGPTETIVCTAQEMSGCSEVDAGCIGLAVPGMEVILLNQESEQGAADGEVGEICVAGPQLFRNYLGSDESQPYTRHRDGKEFYRTGDLGIMQTTSLGQQTIRYLGRHDDQLKIHGVRVDSGEIESVLGVCSIVKQCAAIVPKSGPCRDQLNAVIGVESPNGGSASKKAFSITLLSPSTEAQDELKTVQESAMEFLPPGLIPTRWWLVERLPLTATGKIDRLEIRSWLESMSNEDAVGHLQAWGSSPKTQAPGSEVEDEIQSLWSDILGLPKSVLGLETSLFDLGADSVAVIRFTSKARQVGLPITYQQIFEARNIRKLGALVGLNTDLKTAQGNGKEKTPSHEQAACLKTTSLDGPKESNPKVAALFELAAKECGVDPHDVEDVYLCTPLQESLMACTARTPAAYIFEFSYRLSANIQIDRFREAWEQLMLTEPVLRNRMVHVPRAARHEANESLQSEQSSIPAPSRPHSHHDSSTSQNNTQELPTAHVHERSTHSSPDSMTARCLSADFLQVTVRHTKCSWDRGQFDAPMSYGSDLCRCAVFRDEEKGRWSFKIKIHHSLLDGWSLNLMLSRLHAALSPESSLGRGPSFAAFIEHARRVWDHDHHLHAEFWREYLAGATTLDVPRTSRSPNVDVWADRTSVFTVPLDLRRIGRRYGVTSAIVLYAASALVLGRHGDTEDVVFGLSLSGRDAPVDGIEEMVGPTLATIPFRMCLDRAASVSRFLQAVEQEAVKVIPHEQFGLQNIRNIGKHAERASSFRCLVAVQQEEQDEKYESDFRRIHGPESGNPHLIPLAIEYILQRQGFSIHLHFDTSFISEAEVQSIASHLMSIHRAVNRCLHEMLREKVEEFQTLPAVLEESTKRSISYGELGLVSTKLAQALKCECQIGPEVIVLLGFPKTIMAIVTMLAVLKSGGAYAALDLEYPRERFRQIVDQTGATLILCDPGNVTAFHGLVDRVIPIENAWLDTSNDCSLTAGSNGPGNPIAPRTSRGEPDAECSQSKSDTVQPSNLAIVIYSSGSTGQPKGILLSHSALSTNVTLIAQYFELPPGSRVFQFSLAFDISLSDIFVTLLSGGCICLPSEHNRLNRLSVSMREMSVDVAFLTPSVAGLISPEEVSCLRVLAISGEAMPPSLVKTWVGRVRLIHGYGPAEATIISSMIDMVYDSDPGYIGRNLTGLHWVVEKDHLGQVSLAQNFCVGEIAISGDCLAKGYLGLPDTTKKSFINAPDFVKKLGSSRLYLTGDIGRYEQDENIRFLGRNDSQVKINGIRIEPGESEHHLRLIGGAFSTTVVECVPVAGGPKLVAFIVACSEQYDPRSDDLLVADVPDRFREDCLDVQRRLHQVLPHSFIPAVFVPVTHIPKTTNGKLDRKHLRAVFEDAMAQGLRSVMIGLETRGKGRDPQTEEEIALMDAWKEVLDKDVRLNVADNFFHLGGDSLMAIKLVRAARQRGFELEVCAVHGNPTLEEMAASMMPAVRN